MMALIGRSIETRADYAQAATIDAEILPDANDGTKIIVVTTKNVTSFRLDPPAELLAKTASVKLEINGEKTDIARTTDGAIWWPKAPDATKTETAPKSPLHSGPIKNCYREPFLLVYGTQPPKDGVNEDKIAAQFWAEQWRVYADGIPPLKADSAVSEADKSAYNLVLFGSRESNKLLGEISR